MRRFLPLFIVTAITAALIVLGFLVHPAWAFGLLLAGPLSLLGIYDLVQRKHSILRNYPLIGHFRFMFEAIRPEIHQYFIESDIDGRPFSREQRSLVYERAKDIEGFMPFGTERDVDEPGYAFLRHSITAHEIDPPDFHIQVGSHGAKQARPSLLNISAMSYGALGPNAIEAMNRGAAKGDFYHCTGEGGLSPYHLKGGAGVIWQIGTGYFGCRKDDGSFDPELFEEQSTQDAVKMIEIKLSQGAKPGHGGVLPAAKVTEQIAKTRKVKVGQDCISPPGHSAFERRWKCAHSSRSCAICPAASLWASNSAWVWRASFTRSARR
ncbi:MAG: FMN-binding glutamate synthase family protein [Bryobacterales bacterium]